MVGKYLDGLTKEQEDRILTGKLGKAPGYSRPDGCRCVRGWGEDLTAENTRLLGWQRASGEMPPDFVGRRFDELCDRLGEDVAGDLVRSRILVNQLKRSLAAVRATAGV